jgi:hypothetical protein
VHGLLVALGLLKNRDLRRLMVALAAFALTEHALWLAVMIFAYQQGGVAETGLVLFSILIPSAMVAPLAARAIGPLGGGRALLGGFVIQSALTAVAAGVLMADAPVGWIYGATLASSVSLVLTRPAAAALIPTLARSVDDLTAANATSGLVAMVGLFAGPALAGFLQAATSLSVVFWVNAGFMALAALLVSGLARPADDVTHDIVVTGATDGSQPRPVSLTPASTDASVDVGAIRLLIALQALMFTMVGALDVAFVAAAVELVGRSEATAGALNAAHGFGAFVGAIATLSLVGRRRLTPTIAGSAAACGVAIAALSLVDELWPALGLLAVTGAGRAVAAVASRTMLQGLTPSYTLGRVFGALEGVSMFAIAVGALTFSVGADRFGLKPALVGVGILLPVAVTLSLSRLGSIDRRRPRVDAEVISIMRATPVFGPLPPYAVEHMLANLGRRSFGPGTPIIRQGEPGDEIFVLVQGDAEVIRVNGERLRLSVGDYFGEIALLFERPRTASVIAGAAGATALTVDRATYQSAIGVNPHSHGQIVVKARRLLEGDGLDA